MNKELLIHYLTEIREFRKQKKIHIRIGKDSTNINANLSAVDLIEKNIDVNIMNYVLSSVFQITTLVLSGQQEVAFKQTKNFFPEVPTDTALKAIDEYFITNKFKRSYWHRVTSISDVMDRFEFSLVTRPSSNQELVTDIPSVQVSIKTRSSANVEIVKDNFFELSVDDINELITVLTSMQKTIQEKTRGTIYFIEEGSEE